MTAAALLAELDAAGIHVIRESDNLRVRAEPGVSITPFITDIRQHKPALLRELLQRRIVQAATVVPERFDRAAYDALWVVWHAEDAKREESTL